MPTHKLTCAKCGNDISLTCKSADEATNFIENENLEYSKYLQKKERYLLIAINKYTHLMTAARNIFENVNDWQIALAVQSKILLIVDGYARSEIRRQKPKGPNDIHILVLDFLRLFDELMGEKYKSYVENEERQGVSEKDFYTRINSWGNNPTSGGH